MFRTVPIKTINRRHRASRLVLLGGFSMLVVTAGAAQATRVSIDVAPGDSPTVIEAGRGGLLPVAILSAAGFDATSVDPATVLFGPVDKEVEAVRIVTEDVDRDSRMDVMLLVRVGDLDLTCGEILLRLTARTRAGAAVEGSETVTVVGCGPR